MVEGDGNNGNKIAIAVQEEKIDNILELLKQQNAVLNIYFGADGICPNERAATAVSIAESDAAVSNIRTHIKGLWAIVTFIVGVLVTIAIDVIKKQ
jgi:hypothetical protein